MGSITRTQPTLTGLGCCVVAVAWLILSPADPRAAGTPPAAATPAGSPLADPLVQIEIEDNTFLPWRLTVPAGTTVRWINRDARAHTATAADGGFDSNRLSYRANFHHTFAAPGTYDYVCLYHNDMSGTVVVR